jgi:hypothetical protein
VATGDGDDGKITVMFAGVVFYFYFEGKPPRQLYYFFLFV